MQIVISNFKNLSHRHCLKSWWDILQDIKIGHHGYPKCQPGQNHPTIIPTSQLARLKASPILRWNGTAVLLALQKNRDSLIP